MTSATRFLWSIAVLATGLADLGAQVNDTCGGAITISSPSVTNGNTTGASTTSGQTGCSVGPDLWYKFVAPYYGTAEVTTCGFLGGSASFDTVINVWSWTFNACAIGCGLCGPGHITCNDDYCGTQSYLSFPINLGQTYHISIGGYNGQTGTFGLAFVTTPNTPPNDSCATAVPIAVNSSAGGDTSGAHTGPDPVGSCGSMAKDVWYSFVAPSCGTFTATTCGSADFDTVIAVWQGACGSLTQLACNDDSCAPPGQSVHSTVSFVGTLGTTYHISVGGFAGAWGTFSLSLSGSAAVPLTLSFINSGVGTLGYTVLGATPGGALLTAITLNPGAYPSGWFHGIDIPFTELVSEWLTGYPFVTVPGGTCNSASVGPVGGLPSGLTAYGVTLALPAGTFIPTAITPPASGTVP